MRAVDIRLVARAMQGTKAIATTSKRHAPAPHKTRAENDWPVDKPVARKLTLALLWIVSSSTMAQRHSLALRVYGVHVMLLQLCHPLDMLRKILVKVSFGRDVAAQVSEPADKKPVFGVLRPIFFSLLAQSASPVVNVLIHFSAHM